MATVSVVIPTHNRAHVLPQTIQSVLEQTFTDLEVWVVDDGSVDHTHDVMSRYQDSRVHYVWQENRGVSAARNTGMRVSAGELIAFLDSDDLWHPEKLARQVEFFKRHPEVSVLCCDLVKFGQESSGPFAHSVPHFSSLLRQYRHGDACILPSHAMYECLLKEVPIRPSTFIGRQKTLALYPFNEGIRRSADWEFFLRLARQEAFGFLDVPLVKLRIWDECMHLIDREEGYQVSIGVLQREAASQMLTRRQKALLRHGLGQRYAALGRYLQSRGARARAATAFLRAFFVSGKPVLVGHALGAWCPARLYRMMQTTKRRLPFALKAPGQATGGTES